MTICARSSQQIHETHNENGIEITHTCIYIHVHVNHLSCSSAGPQRQMHTCKSGQKHTIIPKRNTNTHYTTCHVIQNIATKQHSVDICLIMDKT